MSESSEINSVTLDIESNSKAVDQSNIIVKIIEENLLDSIKKIIVDEELKKKYTIVLNDEVLDIINKILLKTPNTFNDIEKSIKEVISDAKINSSDIPQLIILVQSIYQVIYTIKKTKFDESKIADIAGKIIKFVIRILVEERKIRVDENDKEVFFKQTDLLIDSCVSLLSFPKKIKPKSCFHSIFG